MRRFCYDNYGILMHEILVKNRMFFIFFEGKKTERVAASVGAKPKAQKRERKRERNILLRFTPCT